jgi:hypothetical protein
MGAWSIWHLDDQYYARRYPEWDPVAATNLVNGLDIRCARIHFSDSDPNCWNEDGTAMSTGALAASLAYVQDCLDVGMYLMMQMDASPPDGKGSSSMLDKVAEIEALDAQVEGGTPLTPEQQEQRLEILDFFKDAVDLYALRKKNIWRQFCEGTQGMSDRLAM